MAKPNKTVGEFLRRFPRPRDNEARAEAARQRDPELWSVMDRVSRGEMTPEEGAAAVRKLQETKGA